MGLRDRLKGAIKKAARKDSGPSAMARRTAARRDLPKGPDADGFHAVCTSELLAEGKGTTFAVEGHNIAVFRVGGEVYAIDDACTHEDGPLGEGDLLGTIVTCPYHDWRYNVASGECLTDAERPVACYATKEVAGVVWVGKKTRAGTASRGGEHDDGLKTRLVD